MAFSMMAVTRAVKRNGFSEPVRMALWACPFAALAGVGFYWLAADSDVPGPASAVAASPAQAPSAPAAAVTRGRVAVAKPVVVNERGAAPRPPTSDHAQEQAAQEQAVRHDAQARGPAWRYSAAGVERWRFEDAVRLDLRGRSLRNADLARVDMADADLRGADLSGANLEQASLRGANLEGAVLNRTRLGAADLRNAVLRGVRMRGTTHFTGADLRGADLREVHLSCRDCGSVSTLDNANLTGADLRGAEFNGTGLLIAILDGADLRGADLSVVSGAPKSMRGARYDRHTRFPPDWFDPTRSRAARSREHWGLIFVPDAEPTPTP